MSSNYFDADWTEKVTLPVKRVGAHWEFFYGGDVPVREGTLAELTLDARDISAWDEVERALGWRPTPPQPKNSKQSTKQSTKK